MYDGNNVWENVYSSLLIPLEDFTMFKIQRYIGLIRDLNYYSTNVTQLHRVSLYDTIISPGALLCMEILQ
jgi:hypothetical protein